MTNPQFRKPSDIIADAERSRSLKVSVGKFTFYARRLTASEAFHLARADPTPDQIAREFVQGWDHVHEDDILFNGCSDPVQFDEALWHDWCNDRPDFWKPISSQVMSSYSAYLEKLGIQLKN